MLLLFFNNDLDCFYEEGVCYQKETECIDYGSNVEACNSDKHKTNTLGIYIYIHIRIIFKFIFKFIVRFIVRFIVKFI
jgi:hypothetical protein